MFCKYCGSEIADDALFCQKCGKKLVSTDEQETSFYTQGTEKASEQSNEPLRLTNTKSLKESSSIFKQIKKLPRSVIITAIVLCVIVIGLPVKKRISVELYKNGEKWSAYEAKLDRFNELVDVYNGNKNSQNAIASDTAGLDALEAYLDYYEGKVKVQGKGDYSYMNEEVDHWMILIENNHNNRFWGSSDYDYRMAQIKNRWRYLKR